MLWYSFIFLIFMGYVAAWQVLGLFNRYVQIFSDFAVLQHEFALTLTRRLTGRGIWSYRMLTTRLINAELSMEMVVHSVFCRTFSW